MSLLSCTVTGVKSSSSINNFTCRLFSALPAGRRLPYASIFRLPHSDFLLLFSAFCILFFQLPHSDFRLLFSALLSSDFCSLTSDIRLLTPDLCFYHSSIESRNSCFKSSAPAGRGDILVTRCWGRVAATILSTSSGP